MVRYLLLVILLLGVLCTAWAVWGLPPAASPNQPASAQPMLFRIIVGLTDDAERGWEGRLLVSGGELAGCSGWRLGPKDRVSADGTFQFQTRIGNLENQLRKDNLYGQTDWNDPNIRRVIPRGMVVQVRGPESAFVRFESGSGSFDFRPSEAPLGRPLTVMGGNASVERLPWGEKLSEENRDDDYPAVAVTPDGTRWTVWLSYRDAADVVVASDGARTYRLTGNGDHHAPALVSDGTGRLHAVWSANENGIYHLFGVVFEGGSWSKPTKLTSAGGSNLWPRLASDGSGKLALVWQGFREDQSVILGRLYDGRQWGPETRLSSGSGNCWMPSAAYGGGRLWVAWDSYATGAYQIYAKPWSGKVERITRDANFAVRASVVVTAAGQPIVAWEESDANWGKDFVFLLDRRGTTLYKNRRVRVARREGSEWMEITAPVADAFPAGIRRFIQHPQLATDADGRLYMALRSRTYTSTSRIDFWAVNGVWESFLSWWDGSRWSPAILMPSSMGRNGMRSAIALHGGQVHIVWPTDNRAWPSSRYGELDIYAAKLPASAPPARFSGGAPVESAAAPAAIHANETESVRRIRDYRITIGGKQYRILRGDLHRHTELSNDGAGDGSLDELYRYALDAAAMDYAHVGDHQMGSDEEYNWWITQKSNDLYQMPRRFVPLFGYERSVWWPNGHRNVIWAERGKPVLRIGPEEAKGGADSGPILYPYLRQTGGIATPHSSATPQGTDWRDNDPELEPFVEIYQGFESNYEHAGAPRSWKEGDRPVHQGLRTEGYVWNAWAKGYKLGVQASSDHISTHASYACILVEDFTRQGLLDAMRRRHSYAATDNIVLDYRLVAGKSTYMMGDSGTSSSPPRLIVKIIGTAPIKQVDVIKNNKYVHQVSPKRREESFEYVDSSFGEGDNYYYIRVEQTDGQLAWSSPIWVTHQKP